MGLRTAERSTRSRARVLAREFYARPVLEVAAALIGCSVEHQGVGGVIVETEAYHESEPACHAYVGLTKRTSTLFGGPGRAYVYLSYGVHTMLNAVCEPAGVGAAVLIRALEPSLGIETMRSRRSTSRLEDLCSGPGKLAQALEVGLSLDGTDLIGGPIVIRERAADWLEPALMSGTRIGITKAITLPWRFWAEGNPHVSRGRPSPGAGGRASGGPNRPG